MKKKILLLLAFMVCSAASLFAQTALVVVQKSGGNVYYSFEDSPKVTFTSENVVISTSKTVVEYPLADLLSFNFDDMANGVYGIKSDGAKVQMTDNMVVVTGLSKGEVVSAYDAKGIRVATAKAANGVASLSLRNLPGGVYVIKSKGVSYKISRK